MREWSLTGLVMRSVGLCVCTVLPAMPPYIRKNITPAAAMDARLRELAKTRGASQSGLIVHLVTLGLATQSGEGEPLMLYLGCIEGPADLSATVDRTVYGTDLPRWQRLADSRGEPRRRI